MQVSFDDKQNNQNYSATLFYLFAHQPDNDGYKTKTTILVRAIIITSANNKKMKEIMKSKTGACHIVFSLLSDEIQHE